jgi:hypothetical protein
MDAYQPATATYSEVCASERRQEAEQVLTHAYAEGRSAEREQWVPLANLMRAHFMQYALGDGSVHLPMAAVLELSAALGRVQGD